MTSLGWTLNSGSELVFNGILFLFFTGNKTVFVQFRQSTLCRPTISCNVLSVLFAATPICCTCCLDKFASFHWVLYQVTFTLLSMLLISLQWSWWPFLQCNILFTCNGLIFREKNGWSQEVREYLMAVDQGYVHNQFYYFCHQIQDKCDNIMFIISMNNTR